MIRRPPPIRGAAPADARSPRWRFVPGLCTPQGQTHNSAASPRRRAMEAAAHALGALADMAKRIEGEIEAAHSRLHRGRGGTIEQAEEGLRCQRQPREQTVRHVHVNEGGQAVIADQFHNHTGGQQNGKSADQPHAAGAAGTSAALPSPDPFRNGMPVTSREGQPAMQDAWRQGKRRA